MFISTSEIDHLTLYWLGMIWLNWSLKLHTRLWTSYTWSTHTRHKTNVQLFHLCDCTCSNVMCILNCLSIKSKKIFEHFICFWKCFYAFVCLEFLFILPISCFFQQKTLSEAFSWEARELALPAKMRMAK